MNVANRLRHMHREYFELKAQYGDSQRFDKRWKRRRVQVGADVNLNRQTFGAFLTLAVRSGKCWVVLMKIVDGIITKKGG